MKRFKSFVAFMLSVIILLTASFFVPLAAGDGRITEGSYNYYSQITKSNQSYNFYFDEDYFKNSSFQYNHSLAKMSLRLAMAAGDTTDTNIKDLYDKLGISYTEKSVSYPVPAFDYESDFSTIGYAVGSKEIFKSGEKATLITLAVRGGGYNDEWGSNFQIGNENEHKGFGKAAKTVTDAVEDYIKELNPKTPVKIWITGFSRGAAVSNICAHYLNAAAEENRLSGAKKEDIFSYCFECPRTVLSGALPKTPERNIKNIINNADLVTKVAPSAWEFLRYGVDYCLPTAVSTSDYASYHTAMETEYKKITAALSGAEDTDDLAVTYASTVKNQVTFTQDIIDALAEFFVSKDNFVKNKEKDFCGYAVELSKLEKFDIFSLPSDLLYLLISFAQVQPNIVARLYNDAVAAMYAHYPEMCLAWMDSIKGEGDFVNPFTRKITVTGECDVTVTDSRKNTVASFVGAGASSLTTDIEFYINQKGEKIIILPFDCEYNVELSCTAKGNITYTVTETELSSGALRRTVGYTVNNVSEDDIFNGEILKTDAEKLAKNEYPLYNAQKTPIEPTVDEGGVITGDYDNNGSVDSDDAIFLLRSTMFASYERNQPSDYNHDGAVTSDDAIYLLRHTLFGESAYPLDPWE